METGTEDDHTDVRAVVQAARRALLVRGWLPREGPTRWRRYAVAGVVLAGLLVLGILAFARGQPTAQSPPPLPAAVAHVPRSAAPAPPPRPTTLVVAVVGRVGHAGLVRVPDGARVADAVSAAGGPLPGVDLTTLNLARKVNDGEQLFVGVPIPPWALQAAGAAAPAGPSGPSGSSGSSGSSGAGPGAPGGKVGLNSATAAQLDQLPGVGAITAKHIVDWRTQHGRFNTVDQLKDVPGIGDGKFEKLKDQVTLG